MLCASRLSIEIADPSGHVTCRNSFVTDLASIAKTSSNSPPAAGRAGRSGPSLSTRLKTKGYNLEHNFGHGRNNLAAVLAVLNLLAFACYTLADLVNDLWKRARTKAHTGLGFFNHLRSITVFVVFPPGRTSSKHLLSKSHYHATLAKIPK